MFLSRLFVDQYDRWFFWLPVFMAAGIGLYFALPFEPSALAFIAAPVMGLGFLAFRKHALLAPFFAALFAFSLGLNAAQLETRLTARPFLNERTEPLPLFGLLYRAEALPEGNSRLLLKNVWLPDWPKEKRPRFVRVKVRTPLTELPQPGSRVSVWGPLWPPADPALPNGYDFRRGAFFKQLGASGIAYGNLREHEAKYPPRFFWDGFNLVFEKIRRKLAIMAFSRLPPDQAPMTAALLTGSQTGINRDVMKAMRASGLSHLLSISGVHVSMIALLIYVPLRFLLACFPWFALRLPIKKIAASTSIFGTTLYTILVGSDPPTVRSALMTGIVMAAVIADRKALSLRLVALAALIVMLATPSAAIGPSFQMSFAAVLAMVAAYEKRLDAALKEGLSFELPVWIKNLWRHARDIILTSIVATAATAPFTLFHFNVFSFYGVAANMIAIPLTSLWIMPCLLLTYLAAPFGLAGPLLDGAGWGITAIIRIAESVAAWPHAQIFAPPMPVWAFGLFVFGGLWLCLWRGRIRLFGFAPILVACFYPLTVPLPSVFVAAEDGVWAVRLADERLAAFGKRRENFTISQWRQSILNPETVYFTKKKLPDLGEELSCDETACAFKQKNLTALFLLKDARPENIETFCKEREVDLLVSPFAALSACKAKKIIDQAALSERGAHTAKMTEKGLAIETVRPQRGERPWNAGHSQNAFRFPP